MLISLLLAAHLVQALPGAETAPPVPTPEVRAGDNIRSPDADDQPPARTCRMEPVTGSRFPVRICRGPRNAATQRNDSRDLLRNAQGLPELLPSSASPKGIPGI